MKIYKDFESLESDFSISAFYIKDENSQQYPSAKFIIGAYEDDDDGLNVFFETENKDMVLWVWVQGVELGNEDDCYIDEYYEIPISEAQQHYSYFPR